MADKKISELDLALLINNDAVFPMSQDNAGEPTTFKVGITQLGTEIAEDMTFSNLQTTSKKLVGAINELARLGSPILLGTTAPTSSIGADGNIYVQYTAGTGGADDEVDGIFVKIDGAWCEISTGGGGGTTDYADLSNKPQVNSVELVGNKSLDDLGIMPASLSKTVSGSLVHITDGADNIPVKSLVSEIVAVESGSGEKSSDNPYTISGFDNGIITRLGKNLIDDSKYYQLNASIVVVGQTETNANRRVYLPKGTYTINVTSNVSATIYYDFGSGSTSLGNTTEPRTFTLSENSYCSFWLYKSGGFTPSDYTSIQLEVGTTATTYEPYTSNTYTFAFGQTVYGGYFDNKGNLVITHDVVDLSQISTGGTAGSGYVWYMTLTNPKTVPNTDIAPIVSEKYNAIRYNAVASTVNSIAIRDNGVLYVNNGSDTTQPSGIAKYELANPIVLPITSQDIPTLLGENNIFSNCGDVEVDYYTDNADEIVEVAKSTASTPLHNYSTDEQVVGTWIDGSTIYEKTFELDNQLEVSYTSWTSTGITADYISAIFGAEMFGVSNYQGGALANIQNSVIQLQALRNSNAFPKAFTLHYTKSST